VVSGIKEFSGGRFTERVSAVRRAECQSRAAEIEE
jgi:hypothetical protein